MDENSGCEPKMLRAMKLKDAKNTSADVRDISVCTLSSLFHIHIVM